MSLDNAQFIPQEAVDAEEYKRTKEGKIAELAASAERARNILDRKSDWEAEKAIVAKDADDSGDWLDKSLENPARMESLDDLVVQHERDIEEARNRAIAAAEHMPSAPTVKPKSGVKSPPLPGSIQTQYTDRPQQPSA